MTNGFDAEASRFLNASAKLALLARTKAPRETLEMHMRQFIGNVLAITPPAHGDLSQGKKAGEDAILASLLNIARPVTGRVVRGKGGGIITADELLALHARLRNKSTGRTVPLGGGPVSVSDSDFRSVLNQLVALVGILGAGWNRACSALKVTGVPAWIRRHGEKYGVVQLVAGPTSMTLLIGNDVPFADGVSDLQRRVTAALGMTAAQLEKGYEQALARAARASGFR